MTNKIKSGLVTHVHAFTFKLSLSSYKRVYEETDDVNQMVRRDWELTQQLWESTLESG